MRSRGSKYDKLKCEEWKVRVATVYGPTVEAPRKK